MPGSQYNWKAKEIREYLEQHYSGTIFISRKPTNSEALVLDKESGRVLFRAAQNYGVVEQITKEKAPHKVNGFFSDKEIGGLPIKTRAENTAINAICELNELRELLNGHFKIQYDENGFVKEIKSGELIFTQKSRRR